MAQGKETMERRSYLGPRWARRSNPKALLVPGTSWAGTASAEEETIRAGPTGIPEASAGGTGGLSDFAGFDARSVRIDTCPVLSSDVDREWGEQWVNFRRPPKWVRWELNGLANQECVFDIVDESEDEAPTRFSMKIVNVRSRQN